MTALREQCIEVWGRQLIPAGVDVETLARWRCDELRTCLLSNASEYLGRLLQANGCRTVDEIVRAAEATCADWCSQCGQTLSRPACGPTHAARLAEYRHKLFAAILTEALAKGRGETFDRSWFERCGIAEFTTGKSCCGHVRGVHADYVREDYVDGMFPWCRQCQSEHSYAEPRAFVIPPLTIPSTEDAQ